MGLPEGAGGDNGAEPGKTGTDTRQTSFIRCKYLPTEGPPGGPRGSRSAAGIWSNPRSSGAGAGDGTSQIRHSRGADAFVRPRFGLLSKAASMILHIAG